jgi:hypothetical protein
MGFESSALYTKNGELLAVEGFLSWLSGIRYSDYVLLCLREGKFHREICPLQTDVCLDILQRTEPRKILITYAGNVFILERIILAKGFHVRGLNGP